MLNTKKDRISLKNIIPVMNKHCNSRVVLFVAFFLLRCKKLCDFHFIWKKVLFYELMKWKKKLKEKFSIQNIETRKLNSTTEKRICARDSSSSTNEVDSVQQTRTGNISCILSQNPGREGSLRTRQKICLCFLNGTPNLDFQRHTSNRVD